MGFFCFCGSSTKTKRRWALTASAPSIAQKMPRKKKVVKKNKHLNIIIDESERTEDTVVHERSDMEYQNAVAPCKSTKVLSVSDNINPSRWAPCDSSSHYHRKSSPPPPSLSSQKSIRKQQQPQEKQRSLSRQGSSCSASKKRQGRSRSASKKRQSRSRSASKNRQGSTCSAFKKRHGRSSSASKKRHGRSRSASKKRQGRSRSASKTRQELSRFLDSRSTSKKSRQPQLVADSQCRLCPNHPYVELQRLSRKTGEWKTLLDSCPLCSAVEEDSDTRVSPSKSTSRKQQKPPECQPKHKRSRSHSRPKLTKQPGQRSRSHSQPRRSKRFSQTSTEDPPEEKLLDSLSFSSSKRFSQTSTEDPPEEKLLDSRPLSSVVDKENKEITARTSVCSSLSKSTNCKQQEPTYCQLKQRSRSNSRPKLTKQPGQGSRSHSQPRHCRRLEQTSSEDPPDETSFDSRHLCSDSATDKESTAGSVDCASLSSKSTYRKQQQAEHPTQRSISHSRPRSTSQPVQRSRSHSESRRCTRLVQTSTADDPFGFDRTSKKVEELHRDGFFSLSSQASSATLSVDTNRGDTASSFTSFARAAASLVNPKEVKRVRFVDGMTDSPQDQSTSSASSVTQDVHTYSENQVGRYEF